MHWCKRSSVVSFWTKKKRGVRPAKFTQCRARSMEPLESRVYLSSGTGLAADYFNAGSGVFSASSVAVTAAPALARTDSTVNFNWGTGSPDAGTVNSDNFAVRWSGQVLSEQAGTYVFHVMTGAAVRLWVNGQEIINDYTQHASSDVGSVAITLNANTLYNIRLDFAQGTSSSDDSVMLEWVLPSGTRQVIPESQLYPFSTPLTITSGGTYVGSWESNNAFQNAVTIDTTQAVTIDDSTIQGTGTLIFTGTPGVQLTVENSTATGLNPNVAGVAPGEFLEADNAASLDIQNNSISNVGGYALDVHGFTGKGAQTITILDNSFSNINGAYSNGDGGYESTGQATPHAIMLNGVVGVAGINIGWNQIINTPGQSYVNDIINLYESSGTSGSPINIDDNYIQGLYAINPATQQDSGCGIITDGSTADETAYVNIHNNTIISTGNAGIGIAAGHNISAYDNTIVSSGYLPDGAGIYAQNVGLYIWDQMAGGSSADFYDDGAYDNAIGWVQAPKTANNSTSTAKMNDWWFPNATTAMTYGNTNWSGEPTAATQADEYAIWKSNLASNHVTVGLVVSEAVSIATPTVSVEDAGGTYNGSAFAATGLVAGVNSANLGSPTFKYYLASDTSFSNPLSGAPSNAGSYVVVASYAANSNYAAASAHASFSIAPAATTTTVAPSLTTAAQGQVVVLTALVNSVAPGGGLPTSGTVVFSEGSTILGSNTLNSLGAASIALATLPPGYDSIVAKYEGTSDYSGSGSAGKTVTVVPTVAATRTTIISSTGTPVLGEAVTVTATVSEVEPSVGTPTGTVTFIEDGSVSLGTATLSNGVARMTLAPGLFLGLHGITAVYSGSPKAAASTSAEVLEDVTMPATTTASDGLRTATVQAGSGAAAADGDRLEVEYTGYLSNGIIYHSSFSAGQTPSTFTLGTTEIIAGWDQGLVGMKVGETRVLVVPPGLAYESGGTTNVPPNSTIYYVVTLVAIV